MMKKLIPSPWAASASREACDSNKGVVGRA